MTSAIAEKQHPRRAPEPVVTSCLPCVSAWPDVETGGTVYVAEIRYQGSVPPPSPAHRPEGAERHTSAADAFADLAREVRRLPALLRSFEIVVAGKTYADAELAAQAVERERPRCDVASPPSSAWERLTSKSTKRDNS